MDVSLGATRARMLLLAGLGVLLGGVGGAAAFVVVRLVGLLSNLALLHQVGWQLPDLATYHPGPALLGVAAGGALVVALLARYAPVIKGHGIPEALEAITLRESRISPRAALAKPLSAAIAMGTGGPFGAEGPIIVTGGSVGSLVGQLIPVSAAERRILLATGAAAGMAGVFGTPVAAVLLAFELLVLERSLRALLPLLVSTSLATALHDVLLGGRPLFALRHSVAVPTHELWLFALLGVAAGLLAALLDRGLFLFEGGFARLGVPEFFHPLIGALGFAAIGFAVPGSLSVGYWAIADAVNGSFALHVALVLFVAKLFSWWIALASNTSGGTLAPMFLIGATMGEAVGIGFAHAFPDWHIQPAAFALVAMGATFGVGARALLTGAVFAVEVTGGFGLVVPILISLAVAEVVAEQLLAERIMTDRLFRRGYRVELDAQVHPLRSAVCGQVMVPLEPGQPPPRGPVVDRHAYLESASALLSGTGATVAVVIDRGVPCGTIDRRVLEQVVLAGVAERRPQPPQLAPPLLGRRRSRRPSSAEDEACSCASRTTEAACGFEAMPVAEERN